MPATKHRSKNKSARHEQPAGVRPFWSGTISFGLVSVPVNLFPAQRRTKTGLRMLAPDGTPLARRYYCPKHEVEVHPEHIVRGFEVGDEEYVIVRDEELEELQPRKSRDIDLTRFVPRAEVPPLYFERAYFLTPAGDSNKAYRLLAEAMEQQQRAGIATFVMRGKEYLVAILAEGGILRAETLRFEDEVRGPADVGLPPPAEAEASLVREFGKAIDKMTRRTLPLEQMTDESSQQLRELVERKKKKQPGAVIQAEVDGNGKQSYDDDDDNAGLAGDQADGEPVDLLEAIRRQLSQENGSAADGKKSSPRRSPSESADGLQGRTKQELYAMAQELEIEGRSSMTKPQLIRAIEDRR